jgi:hypothetical protein
MAKIVQRRRGTTAEHVAFTGNEGEITVDLTLNTLRVHDGSTVGGTLLAKADMSNVSDSVGIEQLILTDGNPGEVLQTDGAGNLSFTSQPVIPDLTMGGDLSGTVSNAQLKPNVVTETELADNTITTIKIADASVTGPKIANSSITTVHLTPSSITASQIAPGAVEESKIQVNSISTNKILDANITTAKIADNAITGTKISLTGQTQGDIMHYDGANWSRLAPGSTVGQVLQSAGSGAVPVWGSTPYDISFIAGYDSSTAVADLVVQTYGEMVMARTGTFEGDVGLIDTVCTGNTVICDIEKNGTTIYSTKPQFAISAATMSAGVLSTTTFASGDRLTFKVTQIGSTVAGQGLRFMLKCKV